MKDPINDIGKKTATGFKRIFDKKPFYKPVSEFLNRIITGKSRELVEIIRATTDLEERQNLKKQLKAICFSGRFSEDRRDSSLIEHSGFVIGDIDKIKSENALRERQTEIINLPFIYACWVSPSGDGLKFLMLIADGAKHREHFQALLEVIPDMDPSGINVSRVCYESWDPNMYINQRAKAFLKIKCSEKIASKEFVGEYETLQKLVTWTNKKGSEFVNGNRNNYLFLLSAAACRFGVSQEIASNFIGNEFLAGSDLPESEAVATIRSAFRANKHKAGSATFDKEVLIEKTTRKEVIIKGSPDVGESQLPCFGPDVYDNLPAKIRVILDLIGEPRKKDVALQGMITALSSAVSRWRFFHGAESDIKEYSPHLISLVCGAAGSGKGLTRYGYQLVELIAYRAEQMYKEATEKYRSTKSEYDRQKRECDKSSKPSDHLTEPVKPPKYCFGMSASDTTQAALVEILFHNPRGGFAYENEVDAMVQANAQREFGGFSDVVRKVFHHELLSRQRKGDGESYVVSHPRLAIMLSGTHDQLKKLITSEYNGLFSRVWYYIIPNVFQEYKTGSYQSDIVGLACIKLQQEIFETADLWNEELYYLKFTETQEKELFNAMGDKRQMEEVYGGDIGASWLRMALITKRIAVTLAALDDYKSGPVPDNCWKAAMAMLPVMKAHCIQALNIVRTNQGKIEISKEAYQKLKGGGMTDEEIAKEFGVSRRTITARKKEFEENAQNRGCARET